MEKLRIRTVTPEDFEDIAVLNSELGYSYSKERVKHRIESILSGTTDIVLVADILGEVVGYIHASRYELLFHDPLLNILGFVVKKAQRGCGIGGALITELECTAKAQGFVGIRLTSGADRVGAHQFYVKHGYINRKDQKNFIKIFS